MSAAVTIYAIDFGTSNSLLAGVGPDGALPPAPIDPTAPEPTILRSILFFADGEWSFGHEALRSYEAHGARSPRSASNARRASPDSTRSRSAPSLSPRRTTFAAR